MMFLAACAFMTAAGIIFAFIWNRIGESSVVPANPDDGAIKISSIDGRNLSENPPTEGSVEIKKEEYPKRVIVTLKSWSDIESAKKIITDNRGEVLKTLNWPTGNVLIAVLPDKNAEEGILKNSFWGKLVGGIGFSSFGNSLSGGIDSAEIDAEARLQDVQSMDWGIPKIGVNRVWGLTTGKGIKVAVIDSGIQRDHPDLVANVKGGINFTSDRSSAEWYMDGHGHGTRVSGIIAALNNDIGVVGVTPDAELYGVRVLNDTGGGNISDLISGLYWVADNGMDVANMSLGYSNVPNPYQVNQALDYAYNKGVVLVASAGNNGGTDNVAMYPGAYSQAVISVGATDEVDNIAFFSQHGPTVEIAGPGVRINSTAIGGVYNAKNGTSSSAPYVAGVAALILSVNPDMTPAQLRERIDSTAIDLGAPGRDDYYGYGLINALDSIVARPPAKINLISPVGGEGWPQGTKQLVRWSSSDLNSLEKLDIKLVHQGNGTSYMLAPGVVNDGSVLVDIPTGLPSVVMMDNYFLEISCSAGYIGVCEPGRSGLLAVTALNPLSFQVTSQKTGEEWEEGTIQKINWSSNYSGEPNVNISLVKIAEAPQYRLLSQSGDWVSKKFETVAPGQNPAAKDTCDGNIGAELNAGIYSCPAVSTKGTFTCADVAASKVIPNTYWKRDITCTYDTADLGGKAPVFSFIPGSETVSCPIGSGYCLSGMYSLYAYTYTTDSGVPQRDIIPPKPDTCNGMNEKRANYGGPDNFSCPLTNSSEKLNCYSIFKMGNYEVSLGFYESAISCSYQQIGTVDIPPAVKEVPLGGNVINYFFNSQVISDYDKLYEKKLDGSADRYWVFDPRNSWALYDSGHWEDALPNDTCDGITGYNSRYACTATADAGDYTCQDVLESGGYFWERDISCLYDKKEVTEDLVLAGNIENDGYAEIEVPYGFTGSDYFIKVSCNNFTGQCPSGISESPISIVPLNDPKTLTIYKTAGGTISDGTIFCSTESDGYCTVEYPKDAIVTLSASIGNPASIFTGWTGNDDCIGTGLCAIVMDSNKSIVANFSESYLTLTAIADPDSVFTGWSGDCLLNGQCAVGWSPACLTGVPCHIRMATDQPVIANFTKNPQLTINVSGTGTGTVTTSNKKTTCSSGTCTEKYSVGEYEVLTATKPPGSDSTFAGWFGGTCSGTVNLCSFRMDSNRSVTAIFNLPCTADNWICQDWSETSCVNDVRTRRCELVNCPAGADTPSPPTTQSCASKFTPGDIKEVKPN